MDELLRSPTHPKLGEVFKDIYRKELDRLYNPQHDSDDDDYDYDYEAYDFSGDAVTEGVEHDDNSMEQ